MFSTQTSRKVFQLTLTLRYGIHYNLRILPKQTPVQEQQQKQEREKDERHELTVSSTGSVFYPLVVESHGLWSPNSLQVLKTIARRISFQNNSSISQSLCNLHQKLSTKLWMFKSRMVLARMALDSRVSPSWDSFI